MAGPEHEEYTMHRRTAALIVTFAATLAFAAPASAHHMSVAEAMQDTAPEANPPTTNTRSFKAAGDAGGLDFENAPKVQPGELPQLPTWEAAAVSYWSRVAGVRSFAVACPGGADYRIMPGVDYAGGWGRKAFGTTPCMTWFERDDLATAAESGAWYEGRIGCIIETHEMGHMVDVGTPTDDDHKFEGDPNRVMTPQGTVTSDCEAAFPAPEVEREPAQCYPAWAYYSSDRVFNRYSDSFSAELSREQRRAKRAQARRIYAQWKRHHRKAAARIAKRHRRCIR